MTDTAYKARTLPKALKAAGAEARLTSYPAPLFSGPWRQAHGASDYVPAAYRPVLSQHSGGPGEFLVLSSSTTTTQIYPEAGVWRTVMATRTELAPGCALALRVVAVRSGLSQYKAVQLGEDDWEWGDYGVGGRLRVTVEFDNVAADTDSTTVEVELDPSPEDDGAEPTSAGASWSHLLFKCVPLIHTAGVLAGTPAELAKWSENTTITVTVNHQGGARVIHCSLVEIPHQHVVAHDEDAEVSIHGWPSTLQPTTRPQVEDADGATYEEHRLGTARGFVVAQRQSQRLGPLIASWTSYAEDLAEVEDTDPDPISVTASGWSGLSVGSSITDWSTDAPGYDIAGHYARRAPENLSTRLDGAGVIPVRCRVHARFTTAGSATGYVRFQSSARSWVDVDISQATVGTTWTWVTVTGFLECGVAADDPLPVLVDLARVTGGGTMEVRYWAVCYGDHEVGA